MHQIHEFTYKLEMLFRRINNEAHNECMHLHLYRIIDTCWCLYIYNTRVGHYLGGQPLVTICGLLFFNF